MNQAAEKYLQEIIFPDLEKGRPNWDMPHTQSVVAYLQEILEESPEIAIDEEVAMIAAYAHDWGYSGLFDHGTYVSGSNIADQKEAHMAIGAEKIADLLHHPTFDYLSAQQKERIRHLVFVHDRLSQLTELDELILMEADSLGVADISRVKPTLNKKDYERWLLHLRGDRMTKFITKFSKLRIEDLLRERQHYYEHFSVDEMES